MHSFFQSFEIPLHSTLNDSEVEEQEKENIENDKMINVDMMIFMDSFSRFRFSLKEHDKWEFVNFYLNRLTTHSTSLISIQFFNFNGLMLSQA